jgi:hypothetical protein
MLKQTEDEEIKAIVGDLANPVLYEMKALAGDIAISHPRLADLIVSAWCDRNDRIHTDAARPFIFLDAPPEAWKAAAEFAPGLVESAADIMQGQRASTHAANLSGHLYLGHKGGMKWGPCYPLKDPFGEEWQDSARTMLAKVKRGWRRTLISAFISLLVFEDRIYKAFKPTE